MATVAFIDPDDDSGEEPDAPQVPPDVVRREELEARVYSFGDLLYQVPERREPLLGGLVRRGWRTMIAGHTGEGKSTMIGRMVRAMMTGTEFLGFRGLGGVRVLVIDLEQDLIIAQRRLVETWYPEKWDEELTVPEMIDGKLHPEFADAYYCRWSEGLSLNTSEVDAAVVEATIRLVEPDVVVFDPLYKGFEGDPNDQALATAVMRILDGWRERYGFGLIIGAHMRKPERKVSSFTKHDVSASGAWIFGAEVVLGIKRIVGSKAQLHFFKDRAGDLPTDDFWTLAFSPAKGFRREAFEVGDDGAKITNDEKVWRFLQMGEMVGKRFTRSELAAYLSINSDSMVKATDKLVERMEAGRLPGLGYEKGTRGSPNYYWYTPPAKQAAIQEIRDMLDAVEGDE